MDAPSLMGPEIWRSGDRLNKEQGGQNLILVHPISRSPDHPINVNDYFSLL
jgi:hypothetical protein